MTNTIYITLMECGNSECPNIGTIYGDSESVLMEKFKEAVESHFDASVSKIKIQDGLRLMDSRNFLPFDILVHIDGAEVSVEAHRTWLY